MKATVVIECPACSNKRGNKQYKTMAEVYECKKCGAVFGTCYLGDSYTIAWPAFAKGEVPVENERYFDLKCLGSKGITRRHGWFDAETHLLTQVG